MLSAQRGFTLIELLVVIAIMSIVGAFTLANFRSFGEDQKFKNVLLDIQSIFRTAQTNAKSNVKCETQYGSTWQVEFTNATKINLKCSTSTGPQKVLQLNQNDQNILISSVSGTSCTGAMPFTVNFASLSGNVSFSGYPNCTSLTINLTNSKSNKSLIIEQGGRIYEK
ncbi:MAG: prepilin-type N-terminal cleavage/methylation domain-containing protein [Candidatus Daviesbacteria bacterium]|nr:prepilin-type N-terminal cleavage/methylation domain-containing protein [Candidatus Daviesbacteria bacterium]